MPDQAWNGERIDMLKMLWAQGDTATAIAARFGLTRSAVLGKIFRLRLGPADGGDNAKAASAPKPATLARRRCPPPRKTSPAAAAPARGKTLFELTNTCCRWPYRRPGAEKYFFCGVPGADIEGGIPYCARHMKRAYLVPPRLVKSVVKQSRRTAFRAA